MGSTVRSHRPARKTAKHTSQKATTATSAARQSGMQQARARFKMGPPSAGARGPGLSDWIVAAEVSSSMLKKKGMSVSCARLRGQSDPAPRPSS